MERKTNLLQYKRCQRGWSCSLKHPCRIVWHRPSMNSSKSVEVYPTRICLAGAVNHAWHIEIPRLSRRVASLAAKLLRRSVKIATPLRFLDTPRTAARTARGNKPFKKTERFTAMSLDRPQRRLLKKRKAFRSQARPRRYRPRPSRSRPGCRARWRPRCCL